mmetsp:Transcript_36514/g.76653  ORF Transcript_36514/g.76653 Transcript_36514/m.76653 type:complete len:255 (+) Transcript_36514:42-806(+)
MAATQSMPLILYRAVRRYGSVHLSSGRSLTTLSTNTSSPIASLQTFPQHNSTPRHLNPPPHTANNGFQTSFYSSTPPRSVFGWVQEKLSTRAQNKRAAKLVDQVNLMANSKTWTIKMFADEINETLSSWTSKIPGAGNSAEMQQAKETQIVVNAMIGNLGENVTATEISNLDRKAKLKLAIACKKPMDEVNGVLESFKQMEIMHRILRYRKENGIPLPTDQNGLKMAMKEDGMKVMTGQEKVEMRKAYQKSARA